MSTTYYPPKFNPGKIVFDRSGEIEKRKGMEVMSDLRICWYQTNKMRFHGFFERDEVVESSAAFDGSCKYRREVIALLETDTGQIIHATPHNVRFEK